MKDLTLDELLRYVFAGGIALLTLYFSHRGAFENRGSGNAFFDTSVLGAVALIVGSLIYSLHRALLYPLVYRVLTWLLYVRKKKRSERHGLKCCPYTPTELEFNLDIEGWKRNQNEKSMQKNLNSWATQVHFLFCSTWAVVVGLFVGWIAMGKPAHLIPLAVLTCLTAVAACVHDWRFLYLESEIQRDEPSSSGRSRDESHA